METMSWLVKVPHLAFTLSVNLLVLWMTLDLAVEMEGVEEKVEVHRSHLFPFSGVNRDGGIPYRGYNNWWIFAVTYEERSVHLPLVSASVSIPIWGISVDK